MLGKLRNMTSVYLTRGSKILLLYREGSRVANHVWIGSAGGHFEPQDQNDARACVLRELYEEMGITERQISHLALRYITLKRNGDEIRQNYYFFAELPGDPALPLSSNEGILRGFAPEELSSLPMPFTAHYVMQHWVETGRCSNHLYGGIADGRTVVFTEIPDI